MKEQRKPLLYGFSYADAYGFPCVIDAKYARSDNFLGRPVKAYNAPFVVASNAVLDALSKAYPLFREKGLVMKLFDAYRPQRAVDDFAAWAEDLSDTAMRQRHYPKLQKSELFTLDYIARRSGHTRGCAVDLTLIDEATQKELDMGTLFDFMDERSWHGAAGLTAEQQNNRETLKNVMLACGFKINPMEWWHYSLIKEPFPNTYFEFTIG